MFYKVLRKLFRYVLALFMIVWGFSSSFIVISYGSGRSGFEEPLRSFVQTLTMAMGEFNHNDYFEKGKTKQEHYVNRGFAKILLIALILVVTITMLNLFISVIITSEEKLRRSVWEENLFYISQCSRMVSEFWGQSLSKKFKIEETATFCVHKICGSKCKAQKVPNSIQAIESNLRELAAAKIVRRNKSM